MGLRGHRGRKGSLMALEPGGDDAAGARAAGCASIQVADAARKELNRVCTQDRTTLGDWAFLSTDRRLFLYKLPWSV